MELRNHLDAVGLTDSIGVDHLHGTVSAAVDDCQPDRLAGREGREPSDHARGDGPA